MEDARLREPGIDEVCHARPDEFPVLATPRQHAAAVLSTRVAIVHNPGMNRQSSYRGYRFPPEIISHAVWLYHRFTL
ncbi:MAG: hypothetical protein ACREVY_15130, partial [Gammaproteobacteria bacterium]